jgi:hypothetical protein
LYKLILFLLIFKIALFAKINESSLYGTWQCKRVDSVPLTEKSSIKIHLDVKKTFLKEAQSFTQGRIQFYYQMKTKNIFLAAYTLKKSFSWKITHDNLIEKLRTIDIQSMRHSQESQAFKSKIELLLKGFYLKDEVSSSRIKQISANKLILMETCRNKILHRI